MKNVVAQAALIVAAMAAMSLRHYDHNGFATNRRDYRRRYGKKKGGGRGIGMINGLPKSSMALSNPEPTLNWHSQNRASWRKPRVPKDQRA